MTPSVIRGACFPSSSLKILTPTTLISIPVTSNSRHIFQCIFQFRTLLLPLRTHPNFAVSETHVAFNILLRLRVCFSRIWASLGLGLGFFMVHCMNAGGESMGCGGSKVDGLPLVIRCRERKELIRSAAERRYDLSSSHLAYFHSLKDIGYALSRFVDEQLVIPSPSPSHPPPSPVLTLPSHQPKTNKAASPEASIDGGSDSDSDSGSDLSGDGHFHLHHGGGGGLEKGSPPSSPFDPSHNYNQMDGDDSDLVNRGPQHYQPLWGPNQTDWSEANPGEPPHQPPWRPIQTDWREVNPGEPPHKPPWGPNSYIMNPGAPPNQPLWGPSASVMNPSAPPNQPPWGPNADVMNAGAPPPHQPVWDWGPYGGNLDSYSGYGGNYESYNRYGGYSDTNQYAYYMKKPAPPMRTVIHQAGTRGFEETGQWTDPSLHTSYERDGFSQFSMGGPRPPTLHEAKPPSRPPPPPPPQVTGWDFLEFFNTYDNGYSSYGYRYGSMTSSPNSSEVREREGIPDLEEETETESHGEQVSKGKTSNGPSRSVPKENIEATLDSAPLGNSKQEQPVDIDVDQNSSDTIVSESMGKGYDSKRGVGFDVDNGSSAHEAESSMLSSLTTSSSSVSVHGFRDLQEVVNEIKDEFEVAFDYGKEVAVMLEAGKVPYKPRFAVFKVVLSRILYVVAPYLSSSDHPTQSEKSRSRVTKLARSYHLDAVPDVGSSNLSSTLEKLYVWEKKLYKEVKDEERLRVAYDKMCKRLEDLDACGAESGKIDATRASIRRLLTKINVCIKAIDAISSNIHKLRDEELQPQVSQLIYGLTRMWKSVVKCHQKQFRAIVDSKRRSLKANARPGATLELETGLVAWCKRFHEWINAEKSYVDALNGWLRQCLLDHEPELTVDGAAPFSPGRIGAPPIFVTCHDWHTGIERVSEEQLSTAIHGFASNLRQLLGRQDERERLRAEYVAKKAGEWEVPPKGGAELVGGGGGGGSRSLQGGMIPVFKALEDFTCDALRAHEQVRLQNQA